MLCRAAAAQVKQIFIGTYRTMQKHTWIYTPLQHHEKTYRNIKITAQRCWGHSLTTCNVDTMETDKPFLKIYFQVFPFVNPFGTLLLFCEKSVLFPEEAEGRPPPSFAEYSVKIIGFVQKRSKTLACHLFLLKVHFVPFL